MAEFRPFVVLFEPKFVSKLDYQIKRTIIPTCRDCKNRNTIYCPFKRLYKGTKHDDWFCADGVIKE